MRRHTAYLQLACCLAVLAQQPAVLAGSAISVPSEARDTANAAIAAAEAILDGQQAAGYLAEAREYAAKAAVEAAEADRQLLAAEAELKQRLLDMAAAEAEAQSLAEQAQAASALADALNAKAREAIAAAEAAYRRADAVEASLQAAEAALTSQQTAAAPPAGAAMPQPNLEDSDELLRLEKEIRTLEQQQRDAELARQKNIPQLAAQEAGPVDWSAADAAHAFAEHLNRLSLEADKSAEAAERVANQKTVLADEAAYRAAEAKQAMLDARLIAGDAGATALQAKQYAAQTRAELEQLQDEQDHPRGSHFFSTELNYYHWSGDFASRGWQVVQPLDYGYWQRDFSYGLHTRYIMSRNGSAGANGRITTLTDTSVYLQKRNEKPLFTVDYRLNLNLPTGKAALSHSERYATMNEDLVEVSQFGKGWQFAPGIEVSRKIGLEDTWTLGTSYTFSQAYDPTSDLPDDTVSPGDEWRKFLRWQHAGQDWQFVGEVTNTTSGRTKIADGSSYATGSQWEYKLTYNRRLPDKQNLLFYYWRENQDINPVLPADAANSLVHYFGTVWSKQLDERRGFHVSLDVMKTSGSRYAGIYNDFISGANPRYAEVDGRTKYTLGLGYDSKIDDKSKVSFELQGFRMKDGKATTGQPATTYKGFNLLAKYHQNF